MLKAHVSGAPGTTVAEPPCLCRECVVSAGVTCQSSYRAKYGAIEGILRSNTPGPSIDLLSLTLVVSGYLLLCSESNLAEGSALPQQKQARLSIREALPGPSIGTQQTVAESRRANGPAQESEKACIIVQQVGREDVQINSSLITTPRHQLALARVDSKANLTGCCQPSQPGNLRGTSQAHIVQVREYKITLKVTGTLKTTFSLSKTT